MPPSSQTITEKKTHVLEGFVVRATRVACQSLGQDQRELKRVAGLNTDIIRATIDGVTRDYMHVRMPAEELVDSLAARVRPFILPSESINFKKTLTAMSFFSTQQSDAVTGAHITRLRQRAVGLMLDDRLPHGATEVMNQQLGYLWYYGDLVHSDRKSSIDLSISQRFHAGAELTCKIALCGLEILELIKGLQSDGRLALNEEVFDLESAKAMTESFTPISFDAGIKVRVDEDGNDIYRSKATTTGPSVPASNPIFADLVGVAIPGSVKRMSA
jgi:hypothetical protein